MQDKSSQLPPEEYSETSESVRSGEYFREASSVYDAMIHDTMSERYFYVVITALASLILLVALWAMQKLYPLERAVPFIVSSENLVEDVPNIRSLLAEKGDDPSEALLGFMVSNYVKNREEYDIEAIDKNLNGVKTQSTEEVFQQYQDFVDPRNPNSPITQYQRHSTKKIQILNSKLYKTGDSQVMEVLYEASVKGKNTIKKSRWQANISFIYSGIELDDGGEGVKPVTFIVTKYDNKLLQDIQ